MGRKERERERRRERGREREGERGEGEREVGGEPKCHSPRVAAIEGFHCI